MKEFIQWVANDGTRFDERLNCEHHENRANLITKLRAHMNLAESTIKSLLYDIEHSFDLEQAFQDFMRTQDLRRIRGDYREPIDRKVPRQSEPEQ